MSDIASIITTLTEQLLFTKYDNICLQYFLGICFIVKHCCNYENLELSFGYIFQKYQIQWADGKSSKF